MLFDSQVLTVTADPSAGSNLALAPTQQIFTADLDLLDHCLVLCRFSHDSRLDMKATELQLRNQGNPEVAEIGFMKNEQLDIGYNQFC